MTLKRLMMTLGALVFLAGVGIMWLWQYAYTPQGRARVIIAQVKGDTTSWHGWMLRHHVIRPGFKEPHIPGTCVGWEIRQADYRDHAAADELVKLGPEGLPFAIETLKDSDHHARHMAILACGKFRDPAAIQPLVRCMRGAAHDTPGAPSPPKPSEQDLEIQQWCMESLVEIGPPAHGPLLEAAKRCWMEVGYTIPRVIVATWGAEAFPQLMKLLADTDHPTVRVNPVKPPFLRSDGSDSREAYADDIVRNIRCETIIQLGKLKDPRAIDLLTAHLKDEWAVAMFSADALGEIGGPKAVSVLLKAMDDPQIHKMVRMKAAAKAGATGRAEGVNYLLGALKSASSEDRGIAAEELGLAKIKAALDPLITLLGDREEYVRVQAMRALGHLGDPRAIPALKKLLNDPSSFLHTEASKALHDLNAASRPERP